MYLYFITKSFTASAVGDLCMTYADRMFSFKSSFKNHLKFKKMREILEEDNKDKKTTWKYPIMSHAHNRWTRYNTYICYKMEVKWLNGDFIVENVVSARLNHNGFIHISQNNKLNKKNINKMKGKKIPQKQLDDKLLKLSKKYTIQDMELFPKDVIGMIFEYI